MPSRSVTPTPSKRSEMRGRMVEKALKASLPPEAPVMPSRGATSRRSLSFAPCFFRSRSWFSLHAPQCPRHTSADYIPITLHLPALFQLVHPTAAISHQR